MSKLIKGDQWVWVIVQDPGKDEKFLGQYDEEKCISFIPTFLEKEGAQRSLARLKTDGNSLYEPQAVLYEELLNHSKEHGFILFILNGHGEILEKIGP
ncbi:hypothetical protein ACFL1Z_06710 [Thermodesulfobacteriota bacterium]